ncbi:hypothetical protein EDB84DRAFT_1266738 [Lactarius hengduanensis]|nr:hypothetical protein EDB84DRAFT_1266738 [Lactarius hengduanensis]
MWLLYLPPYLLDFNLIEEGISAMKAWIRRNKEFILGEMSGDLTCDPYAMLWKAVFTTMTPENIAGWYRYLQYVT